MLEKYLELLRKEQIVNALRERLKPRIAEYLNCLKNLFNNYLIKLFANSMKSTDWYGRILKNK